MISSHRVVGHSVRSHCSLKLVKIAERALTSWGIFDEPFLESSAQQRWYAPRSRPILVHYLMVTALFDEEAAPSR